MSTFFVTTYVLLWGLVIVLTLMIVLLFRQYGLTMMSNRQRLALTGLDLRAQAPDLLGLISEPEGEPASIAWAEKTAPDVSARFVLLAIATCPICKSLRPTVDELPRSWPNVDFLWIDGRPEEEGITNAAEAEFPAGWRFVMSPDQSAHAAMAVSVYPFAYVVDESGQILGKSVVNDVEDITELLAKALPNPRHLPLTDRVKPADEPRSVYPESPNRKREVADEHAI
jgi:hypothetical protein